MSVVSRKAHGAAGNFDINLPATGTPGVECRNGPVVGEYQIVATFGSSVSVDSASVSSGSGMVNNFAVNGAEVTVNLTSVANAQTIMVTLTNVNDGTNAGNVMIPMSILVGDTNASGAVSSADVSQTKAQTGQTTDGSNFRTDVNVNGSISGTDISQVKSALGTALP